jgi:RNA polymerase primary sigma factor
MQRSQERRDSLSLYLEEIAQYPRLTREDERVLGAQLRSGDPEVVQAAQERLFLGNLRLVVRIAKDFQRDQFQLWDLIAEGNDGLMVAAGKYDERKNVPFSSYAATWIKQRIMRFVPQDMVVRIPPSLSHVVNRMVRLTHQFRNLMGRGPTSAEMARMMHLPEARVIELMQAVQPETSFDSPIGAGDSQDSTLADRLGDTPQEAAARVAERFDHEDRSRTLRSALDRLPEREALVLRLHFGLDTGGDPVDPDFIAQRLGVTRERVRQIRVAALKKLASDATLAEELRDL